MTGLEIRRPRRARLTLPVVVIAALLLLPALRSWSASLLEQGEDALRQNQADKAAALLQASLNEQPNNEQVYLYLGIADLQLGKLDTALSVLKQGLSISTKYADDFYFNMGNIYFMQGQNTLAEGMYSQAIAKNPSFANAYLNRANARMKLESYDNAAQDYTVYLSIDPSSPQRTTIEELLALLNQQKAQVAQQKQLAEQQKLAEAAKQKALLNDVLQSLQSASNTTKNLQAGTAAIQDSKTNLGLDD
ncbi:MAG TPA: tetratricopeptide repeat protein [Spirochaetia bacterium]|nr:tetratricopeptide repeat protein [Spirochaetia bacterium]